MKKILWILAGVGIGFIVAHQMNQTSEGKKFFSELDKHAKGFAGSVVDGYRERESELRSVLADTGDVVSRHAK